MKRTQLAVNSVSTVNAQLEEALPAYAAAGFGQVELFLGHARSFLHEGRILGDLRRRLNDHRVRCIGGFEIAVDCFSTGSPRLENHERSLVNARLIAELGGTMLVVGTDGPPADLPADRIKPALVEGLREVADAIAPYGVTLCLEFNWSPVVKTLSGAVAIAAACERENVGVLFDTAHYHCTATKFEDLNAENVRWIRHVHLNDIRHKAPEWTNCNEDRVLPGEGCLDLPAIIGRLEEKGYNGSFAIEMFGKELADLPVDQAARRMYESLVPLCEA